MIVPISQLSAQDLVRLLERREMGTRTVHERSFGLPYIATGTKGNSMGEWYARVLVQTEAQHGSLSKNEAGGRAVSCSGTRVPSRVEFDC